MYIHYKSVQEYHPEPQNSRHFPMSQPNIPEGVVLRPNRQKFAPMTNFYESDQQNPGNFQKLHHSEFPPPPPFIYQIKDLTRQVMQSNHQFNQNQVKMKPSFELPPPPPELMVQAARSYRVSFAKFCL